MNKFFEDLIVKNKSYHATEEGPNIERYTYFRGCWTEWVGMKLYDISSCSNPTHAVKAPDGRSDISTG